MIAPEQAKRVLDALPFLRRAGPEIQRDLLQTASLARIPVAHDVFVAGDEADAIALLLTGVVRVYKIGETGREITLYRFGLGESCVLTANAILNQQSFPAIATVEQEAEAVLIPAAAFREWVRRTDFWREFVFDLLAQRLASVMAVVDEVAFRRMDARLADLLLRRAQAANPIAATHQELAADLGSSREVISRLLEDFAGRGLVRTARGSIEIVDFQALHAQAVG